MLSDLMIGFMSFVRRNLAGIGLDSRLQVGDSQVAELESTA